MGVQWTEEQQKVIGLRDRNILVSAAAGSGKTAVLVERIIQMLTDEKHPVDVDRLLIVTFTEAAAAEMKERIRNAIEKALENCPENVHLQRQATLIHSASITTIHSFCLSVIREHFHVIDIDPGFRIAEEGELKLLKQDVLEELLENYYADGTGEFLRLVEKLGTGRTDRKLEELVLQLYEYSRSYPQPERWLDECVKNYEPQDKTGEYPIFHQAEQLIGQYLQDMLGMLDRGLKICEEPDGPYMYADMLEADIAMISRLAGCRHEYEENAVWKGPDTECESECASGNFRRIYGQITALKWKRLSTKKDETVSQEKKEQVKSLREQVKKQIKDLTEAYFYETPKELLADMADAHGTMQAFAELVQRFADAFAEKKKSRNLIDFNDMEQFALQILTEEQGGGLVPSMVAREYQEQFGEVMIDEYQDSNLIQEAILTSVSTVSRGRNNIFMVGDVKQSIYRFRLSRPELFMEKYHTYTLSDSDCQRIDLHKNFRSRAEVLDSTNYVFERIMRKELGGVAYDEQAALYLGADYEPVLNADGISANTAELLLIDPAGTEMPGAIQEGASIIKGDARQMEALVVAKRIRELVQFAKVRDKETGAYRQAEYRDIVILTRSVRGWADVFAAVLAEEGIPAYAGSQEGYFETYEVSVLLNYLQLLDNQRQDIPLAAVLTSPFVGLDVGQLAEIRTAAPEEPFYEAAQRYIGGNEEGKVPENKRCPEVKRKLQEFYAQLTHFREMVPYTAIHDLIWKILEETGYGLYISAMPGGGQRMANVEMLVEKASAFEGTSYKGLFNFVRYIDQLKKYDVDYGEANIADEQANTVRIMSIHKSKGLEFPIVFVAGMGKRFNMQDVTGSVIIHPELGVGIDCVDLERRTKIPTFLKKVIQQQTVLENLGEELRVLYVAMTRAKEKLIMTGQLKEAETALERCRCHTTPMPFPFYQLASARSYLDWVLPAAAGQDTPIRIIVWDYWDAAVTDAAAEHAEVLAKDILEHWNTKKVYQPEVKQHLEEQFSYRYPYEDAGKLKLKFTVSELKKRAYLAEEGGELPMEEPETVPLLPKFLQEEGELRGASRGSAYHKLLELLDFSQEYDADSLRETIGRLQAAGKLSKEMAECIRVPDILGLLHCKSGRRMQEAAKQTRLWKEQPFVLGVDAEEVYPGEESTETVLVQGIIDVYFEENGELVVLDYKTDNVRRAEDLREKYHSQLEYYAKALEQLLQKQVKEKIIYSFTLREEIQV